MWYTIDLFREIANETDHEVTFISSKYTNQRYNLKESFFNEIINSAKKIKWLSFVKYTYFSHLKICLSTDANYIIWWTWNSPKELIMTIFLIFISKIRGKKVIINNWDRRRGENPNIKMRITDLIVSFLMKFVNWAIVFWKHADAYVSKSLWFKWKIYSVHQYSKLKIWKKNNMGLKRITDQKTLLFIWRTTVEFKWVSFLKAALKLARKKDPLIVLVLCWGRTTNFNKENWILYLKAVSPEDIHNVYSQSDIFILPSIEDTKWDIEAWWLVINEAMQLWLPIISSNKVGSSISLLSWLQKKYIFQEKNIEEMAEMIVSLAWNSDKRAVLWKRNFNFFLNHLDTKPIIKSWEKIFNEL